MFPGLRDIRFKFWDPPNISGTAEDSVRKCQVKIFLEEQDVRE